MSLSFSSNWASFLPFGLLRLLLRWVAVYTFPIYNRQLLLAPYHCFRSQRKRRNCLKKKIPKYEFQIFFPERNSILRNFLSGMSFSFLFPDFHFQNTIISFPDFFFQNVLFFNSGFFCPK